MAGDRFVYPDASPQHTNVVAPGKRGGHRGAVMARLCLLPCGYAQYMRRRITTVDRSGSTTVAPRPAAGGWSPPLHQDPVRLVGRPGCRTWPQSSWHTGVSPLTCCRQWAGYVRSLRTQYGRPRFSAPAKHSAVEGRIGNLEVRRICSTSRYCACQRWESGRRSRR